MDEELMSKVKKPDVFWPKVLKQFSGLELYRIDIAPRSPILESEVRRPTHLATTRS